MSEKREYPVKEKTMGEKRTSVLNEEMVSRETLLEKAGFAEMYNIFRADGMGRFESFYNAAYLLAHLTYESSDTIVQKKYENVHEHPLGWASDKKKMHRHNKYSAVMRLLDGLAWFHGKGEWLKNGFVKCLRKIKRIPGSMDNSLRAMKAFFRVFGNAALVAAAVAIVWITVSAITGMTENVYGVGVYIDGEYVGNTADVNGIINLKHKYENELSSRFGVPIVLECNISFKPQMYDESSVIITDDTAIFSSYMETFTKQGYGLYIDGKLAAVSEVEKWLVDSVNGYLEKFTSGEKIVLNNDMTIMAGKFPEEYFLTQTELNNLFSVDDELSESGADLTAGFTLNYAGVAGQGLPSSTVKMDVAVEKESTERKAVSYAVKEIFDDTLLEGMRKLESVGVNGEKIVYYKSTYQDGKLVKHVETGEKIVKEPVDRIVRVGTKPATEEEKALIPTGRYIYPNRGLLTSKYGWRVLNGRNDFHQGIDIYNAKGSPLVASDGGEVVEVGYTGGYGKYCIIRHNEEVSTRYAHCNTVDVKVGDIVGQGFPIATMGATGYVTGVHVHFEVIVNGTTVDPLDYINDEEIEWHLLS